MGETGVGGASRFEKVVLLPAEPRFRTLTIG
jgi:hypothetical protein